MSIKKKNRVGRVYLNSRKDSRCWRAELFIDGEKVGNPTVMYFHKKYVPKGSRIGVTQSKGRAREAAENMLHDWCKKRGKSTAGLPKHAEPMPLGDLLNIPKVGGEWVIPQRWDTNERIEVLREKVGHIVSGKARKKQSAAKATLTKHWYALEHFARYDLDFETEQGYDLLVSDVTCEMLDGFLENGIEVEARPTSSDESKHRRKQDGEIERGERTARTACPWGEYGEFTANKNNSEVRALFNKLEVAKLIDRSPSADAKEVGKPESTGTKERFCIPEELLGLIRAAFIGEWGEVRGLIAWVMFLCWARLGMRHHEPQEVLVANVVDRGGDRGIYIRFQNLGTKENAQRILAIKDPREQAEQMALVKDGTKDKARRIIVPPAYNQDFRDLLTIQAKGKIGEQVNNTWLFEGVPHNENFATTWRDLVRGVVGEYQGWIDWRRTASYSKEPDIWDDFIQHLRRNAAVWLYDACGMPKDRVATQLGHSIRTLENNYLFETDMEMDILLRAVTGQMREQNQAAVPEPIPMPGRKSRA